MRPVAARPLMLLPHGPSTVDAHHEYFEPRRLTASTSAPAFGARAPPAPTLPRLPLGAATPLPPERFSATRRAPRRRSPAAQPTPSLSPSLSPPPHHLPPPPPRPPPHATASVASKRSVLAMPEAAHRSGRTSPSGARPALSTAAAASTAGATEAAGSPEAAVQARPLGPREVAAVLGALPCFKGCSAAALRLLASHAAQEEAARTTSRGPRRARGASSSRRVGPASAIRRWRGSTPSTARACRATASVADLGLNPSTSR